MEEYNVIRQIGRGNFGVVLLVNRKRDPSDVLVIKKVGLHHIGSEECEKVAKEVYFASAQ